MKYWQWQEGRQKATKYQKFCLWSFRFFYWGFDAYILKYAPNTKLDWHTDPVEHGEHWRKNFCLKGFASFLIKRNNTIECYSFNNCNWFRPDIHEHMLQVHSTGCKKLSLGYVKYSDSHLSQDDRNFTRFICSITIAIILFIIVLATIALLK